MGGAYLRETLNCLRWQVLLKFFPNRGQIYVCVSALEVSEESGLSLWKNYTVCHLMHGWTRLVWP